MMQAAVMVSAMVWAALTAKPTIGGTESSVWPANLGYS